MNTRSSPAPGARRALSFAGFNLTNPADLSRQQSDPQENESYERDWINLIAQAGQRSAKSSSETTPQRREKVGGWRSFVLDKIMTAGDSLSDIGRQGHQSSVHSLFSHGKNLIRGWKNRNDQRRNTPRYRVKAVKYSEML